MLLSAKHVIQEGARGMRNGGFVDVGGCRIWMGKGLWLDDLDNYIEVGWRGCRKAVDCVGMCWD